MSYALDANILLYASDEASPHQRRSLELIAKAAAGPEIVYLFWPSIMAYLRIATHPAVFRRPLPMDAALANVSALLSLPHVQSPGEQDRFWGNLVAVIADAGPTGNLVPDAHIVGLMLENGVRTIYSHDRDYRRFRGVEVIDPLD